MPITWKDHCCVPREWKSLKFISIYHCQEDLVLPHMFALKTHRRYKAGMRDGKLFIILSLYYLLNKISFVILLVIVFGVNIW